MIAGHYTVYIRNANNWYCYDDSRTYLVEEKDINIRDAYILFYRRKYS